MLTPIAKTKIQLSVEASFRSTTSRRCPLGFRNAFVSGLKVRERSIDHGGRKHAGTSTRWSVRARSPTRKGPLALAQICDADPGFVAGRCSSDYTHPRLERLGRRKN